MHPHGRERFAGRQDAPAGGKGRADAELGGCPDSSGTARRSKASRRRLWRTAGPGRPGDAAQRCRFRPGRLPDRVKQNRSFGNYGTGKSCLQPSGGGGPVMPFFAACGQRKARDKGLRAMRVTGIVLQAYGSSAIMRQGSPVLSSRRRGKVLTAKVAAPAASHRAARL